MWSNELRGDPERCHDICIFQGAQSDLREEELMKPIHLTPILASLDIDVGGAVSGRVLENGTAPSYLRVLRTCNDMKDVG